MKIRKKLEKGTATMIVIFVILFIVIILSTFLVYVTSKRNNQLRETEKLSEIYNGDIQEIYEERKNREKSEEMANIITEKPVEDESAYTCCYADIDDNGTVDGIIFADLGIGVTGDGNWGNSWGDYDIPKKSGFKEYYIKEETHRELKFGNVEGKVIAPVQGSKGVNRFYVMAIEDIDRNMYSWYISAKGKLDNYIDYLVDDFGKGEENTKVMLAEWKKGENGKYGVQNESDLWKKIDEYKSDGQSQWNKWFVPSKTEWAAFGGEVLEKLNITTSNYQNYGFGIFYWSSSQKSPEYAYYADFHGGHMLNNNLNYRKYVRLAVTF